MKRIVQCPKCESKLAVFDIGKTINQKCPRCGNAFEIASDEKPEGAAGKTSEKKKSKKIAAPEAAAPEKEAGKETATVPAAEKTASTDTKSAAEKTEPQPEAAAEKKPEEKAKADEKKAESTAEKTALNPEGQAKADEKKTEVSAEKPEEKAEGQEKKADVAPKKEIALKKPTGRPLAPAPAPAPEPEPPAPAHGVSFLHIVVLFGMLLVVIGALVVSHKKTQARLDKMDKDINQIVKQIQALSKK